MELTKEYFDEKLTSFATKDDLKSFATKDDLKSLAKKDDLTKVLEPLATKQDVDDAVDKLAWIIDKTIAQPMERHFRMSPPRHRGQWN